MRRPLSLCSGTCSPGSRITHLFCLLVLGMVCAASLYAATPEPPKAAPPVYPRSEFQDDPKAGKDPFFPNSSRRQVTNEVAKVTDLGPLTKLKLQGISGSKEKRLAIINNRTFEAGEEADVKIELQQCRIRCLEVREHSAIISIQGMTKELILGQRF